MREHTFRMRSSTASCSKPPQSATLSTCGDYKSSIDITLSNSQLQEPVSNATDYTLIGVGVFAHLAEEIADRPGLVEGCQKLEGISPCAQVLLTLQGQE